MAFWLAKNGYKVRVITANPYYPEWRIHRGFSAWTYSRKFIMGVDTWRCPLYVPSNPKALSRMLHLVSFAVTSLPLVIWQIFWRPSIVFLVVPTIFCSPQALFLSKLTNAKSILHIQDFEVDALLGLGLFARTSYALNFKNCALALERLILTAFDNVSTISPGMLNRALGKGVAIDRLRFLPNWSEVRRFKHASRSSELLNHLGVDSRKKVILYSGNMGEKQGLEIVLKAAKKLESRVDLIFLLAGDGASKSHLMQLSNEWGLSNIVFATLQTYTDLPNFLASADVHLVIQRRGIADLVFPSKLANIFAVGGNSVITADPQTTLGVLCKENPGIAVAVEPESIEELIKGIECALGMPTPNVIAKSYAQEFLDMDQVLTRFFLEK